MNFSETFPISVPKTRPLSPQSSLMLMGVLVSIMGLMVSLCKGVGYCLTYLMQEIDDLRPAKKTKEELEQEYFLEKLQSQDSDTKLAEKPLTDILAPGDYRRHIKDPFYDAKFKFFYR